MKEHLQSPPPRPSPPPQPTPSTASTPGNYPAAPPKTAKAKSAPSSTRGKGKAKPENAYTVADALIAAGVCAESWDGRTITEAQIRDHRNRDRDLDRVAGMKGAALLESRGWVKDGNWWYPHG